MATGTAVFKLGMNQFNTWIVNSPGYDIALQAEAQTINGQSQPGYQWTVGDRVYQNTSVSYKVYLDKFEEQKIAGEPPFNLTYNLIE